MRFDLTIFCNEADTVSQSYTHCDVRMARYCHEANYLVADPFTNKLLFFMSDSMKAINPFLGRIPRELHEQYMTDFMTELMKLNLAETNNSTDDGGTSIKYGLMVAFARKI